MYWQNGVYRGYVATVAGVPKSFCSKQRSPAENLRLATLWVEDVLAGRIEVPKYITFKASKNAYVVQEPGFGKKVFNISEIDHVKNLA